GPPHRFQGAARQLGPGPVAVRGVVRQFVLAPGHPQVGRGYRIELGQFVDAPVADLVHTFVVSSHAGHAIARQPRRTSLARLRNPAKTGAEWEYLRDERQSFPSTTPLASAAARGVHGDLCTARRL